MQPLQKGQQNKAKSILTVVIAAALALLAFCFGRPAAAQTDYTENLGAPTFATMDQVELGLVNFANGNLHMEIPIASFPQRGRKPLSYKLVYDSRIWSVNNYNQWEPTALFGSKWVGWRLVTSNDHGGLGDVSNTTLCTVGGHVVGDVIVSDFNFQAPDGSVHYFNAANLQFSNNCGGTVNLCTAGSANNGTGYFMFDNTQTSCAGKWGTGPTVLAPDGTEVSLPNGNSGVKDANGNFYSLDSNGNIIDQLGRTPVTITTNGTNGCGSNQVCYDVLSSQGGTTRSRWIVTTESIPVYTGFPNNADYNGNISVIQSITLPDGSSYSFTYDQGTTMGHYGEVTGITLPTGGQISYGYTLYSDALGNYQHWVSSHTSGGNPPTTYALGSVNTTNLTQNVTVTKPSGDYKIYAFTLTPKNQLCGGAWKNSAQYYSSTGSLVETINFSWNSQSGCNRIATETVTLPTPGGNISKQTQFTYSANYRGVPNTIKEWNYYSGSPNQNPDRITNVTYLSDTNSAYQPGSANILNLATKVQVTDGNGSPLKETDYGYDASAIGSMPNIYNHDDTNYGTTYTTRGNRTQVQQWEGSSSYLTVSSMNYDETGQMTSSTDANNNQTTYSSADCFLTGNPPSSYTPPQATNAYLTKTTLPVSGNFQNCYYWNTGKTGWSKDQNSATTSYFYITNGSSSNDPFDRLITTTLPTGGWTLNVFSTPPTTLDTYTGIQASSPTTLCTSAGSCRHDQTVLDGLSRPVDQILVNDPDGQTTVQTDYDTNGRVKDTSHPYRSTSDSTYGFETPTYDALNRTTQVLHQDNNKTKTYYGPDVTGAGGLSTQQCPSGTCHTPAYPTLVVDESGKMRQTWTDAFGNIVEVDEPQKTAAIGSFGTPTVTYYRQDLLGNLFQASVKNAGNNECSRTYTYDTLSRMTSSTEPEVGNGSSCTNTYTTNYYHTAAGGSLCSGSTSSLCRRTDGRSITTTYTYDALNRSLGMTYSDSTHAVTYSYDQTSYNGLTITNGAGRRTGMSDGSGTTAWSYDVNGNVLTEKRTVSSVSPSVTKTISYAYNYDNSLKSLTYPSGRVVNFGVSNAQRMTSAIDGNGTQYALAPSSGWMYAPTGGLWSALYGKTGSFAGITESRSFNNRLQLTLVSATSSGGTALNIQPSYNPNGEIATITNSDSTRTANFTYDSLSRITAGSSTATSGSDCWGQSYTTDNVGNLTNIAITKCSGGSLSASVNQNNQFTTGYSYDQAGNLLGDGLYTYAYNAENEITSANGVSYVYDGNRMRIEKSSGTLYWRDTSGNAIAETNLSGTNVNEYVFFAGRRLTQINSSGSVYYYLADQIGSTVAMTNSSGSRCYNVDFTPYGSEVVHSITCAQNYKFTGYERDSETGLDYAFNRYYNSRIGRFMSPDPLGITGATLSNPQSLHRYAYVLNSPVVGIDPLGLECVYVSDGGTGIEEVDPTSTDWDASACTDTGGVYFDGNNEVNGDNWTQDNGNWANFDFDADSNWVGLTNDNGNIQQASCIGGACSDAALRNMGSDYSSFATWANEQFTMQCEYGGCRSGWKRTDILLTRSWLSWLGDAELDTQMGDLSCDTYGCHPTSGKPITKEGVCRMGAGIGLVGLAAVPGADEGFVAAGWGLSATGAIASAPCW